MDDGLTEQQGLYDPTRDERDACGVGFVAHVRGTRRTRSYARASCSRISSHRGAVGCDPCIRRRRRHPPPAAARVLPPRVRASSASSCRGPAATPSACSSSRPTPASAAPASSCSRTSWRRKASTSSAGATSPPTWPRSAPVARAAAPGLPAGVHRARHARPTKKAFERKLYVIRRQAENAIGDARRLLRRQPLVADDRLQGDAHARAARRTSIRDLSDPRLRERARARALALLDEHASRPGSARIRTASSATTARSTRCAAT